MRDANPKKPGKLTKHGVEMSCSVCRSKQHNKRNCPDKDTVIEPQPKRGRGRPRKIIQEENVEDLTTLASQQQHHQQTAIPTAIGRHGRVIIRGGGRGSRGGRTASVSRGGGRGRTGSSASGDNSTTGARDGPANRGRGTRGGRGGSRVIPYTLLLL